MSQIELDPRVQGLYKKLKIGGVAVVAVAASAVVALGSLSIIAAGGLALGAIAVVNFVPVGARYIALKKQQALTALAEKFSEETIREDEQAEQRRIEEQQRLFETQSAEFGNVIDELASNLKSATPEEQELLQGQIDQLQGVLSDTEAAIKQKVDDLVELKRVNKIYIGLHRAAKAMSRSQDLKRNAEEIQRIETARNAIKTRMREALAGQKLEAMNAPLSQKLSVSSVASVSRPALGNNAGQTASFHTMKEVQHVPRDR